MPNKWEWVMGVVLAGSFVGCTVIKVYPDGSGERSSASPPAPTDFAVGYAPTDLALPWKGGSPDLMPPLNQGGSPDLAYPGNPPPPPTDLAPPGNPPPPTDLALPGNPPPPTDLALPPPCSSGH